MTGRRLRPAVGAITALPLALGSVLVWQARRAVGADYLPDPRYEVALTVEAPTAGPEPLDSLASGAHVAEPLRLAVLGDSTVAGIGSPSADTSLAAQVAARVAEALGRPVFVAGHGVSGARTADIAEQAARIDRDRPEAVLVVVGSNDVTHLTPPWSMRTRTAWMLERVGAAAGGAPIVLGGIPEFATVPALDPPLRAAAGTYAVILRQAQRAAATEAGVRFVDIAAEASPRFLGRPESMSPDGFHPSDVGYGLWADALAPAVVEMLRTGTGPAPA